MILDKIVNKLNMWNNALNGPQDKVQYDKIAGYSSPIKSRKYSCVGDVKILGNGKHFLV